MHFAGVAGRNPVGEEAVFGGVGGASHSSEVEAGIAGQSLDFVAKLERIGHGADYMGEF
jgi:hypothetical protein